MLHCSPTSVLHCSPISVLHCQKAHKCSTVERTAMLVWWTPVHLFFFAISICRYYCPRSLHRGDPRAGKSHSTAIKNRKKSSTAIQVLYNHYFLSLHLSLSSPSISPSPLPPSPPLLSEKALLWGVECRTGCHSEGVERRICQKGRLCKNISYRRLLGALWVRGKWGYHQLSCPRIWF